MNPFPDDDGTRSTIPNRPAAGSATASALVGRLVSDTYLVQTPLGRGGMAEVMLARDVLLDRLVAIKFLAADLLEDGAWRDRFVTEARSMARLSHPNLVQVHSYGVHNGWPYFVMEYIQGETLTAWAGRTPGPDVDEVIGVIRQMALGLDAVHAAGLVHHDIKPANVLVSHDGRVVVTDFGLARLVGSPAVGHDMTGTPGYMAPEQSSGSSRADLTTRVDVYQLAVTAYELLVGRAPFSATGHEELLAKHRSDRPPPPSAARPGLHHALDGPILRGLAKDPKRRTPSVMAFSNELERAARQALHRPVRGLVADDSFTARVTRDVRRT